MPSNTNSILITGCSSGIGYDCAHYLAAEGWQVFATCRKPQDVARLQSEGLESFVLDYDDDQSITDGVAEALRRSGGTLDALFNNGAYGIPGLLEDLPRDALRANFETNFFGQHELTRQVIPIMRAQGHGKILMNSSVLGIVALPWRGSYNSTKFAMEGWADTLRLELRGTGIHVVAIAMIVGVDALMNCIVGLAYGVAFNRKHAKKIMRYRSDAKAVAVGLIVLFVFLRR